jgi:hypothetical protein
MRPIEAVERTDTTAKLRTGNVVRCIKDASDYTKTPYMTGWLAGSLYVSRDNGATWAPSDLQFRSA